MLSGILIGGTNVDHLKQASEGYTILAASDPRPLISGELQCKKHQPHTPVFMV